MTTQQSNPLHSQSTPTTQNKQPGLSTPPQKLNLPYSRIRPLAPQSPHRHLRTTSSPASTAYSINNVQSNYPSSGSSIDSESSTSLSSTGTGSSITSQPFSTPPSHLTLPHISLPNIQLGTSTPLPATQDENRPSTPGALRDGQQQPDQQQQVQHIRTLSNTAIPPTASITQSKSKPIKKKSKFSIAVSILLSLHILLVAVLVMVLLGSSTINSQFSDGGYGMIDLRAWMDIDVHIDRNECGSLFEPEPRERVEIGLEGGDDTVELGESIGKEDEDEGEEDVEEIKGTGEDVGVTEKEEGDGKGEKVEVDEIEEMEDVKLTLEAVLEELSMGRLREARL